MGIWQENPIGRMLERSVGGVGFVEKSYYSESAQAKMTQFMFTPDEVGRMQELTKTEDLEQVLTKMFGEDFGTFEYFPSGWAVITVVRELNRFISVALRNNHFKKQGGEN